MCTDEDIGWWCDRLSGEHAGSGFRVETKSGMGRSVWRGLNIRKSYSQKERL